jgi:hypothetical protein
MNPKSMFLWLLSIAMLVSGFHKFGWQGVAVVLGGIMMWMLLHFTRMMTVLKRAANQPMGYVGSAVMLNAKLRKKVSLLHVMALTRSIGLLQTVKDAQPEVYRWQDTGGSQVTCTFIDGKLQSWALYRPIVKDAAPPQGEATAQ